MAPESKIYFHLHDHLAGSFHGMHLCRAGLDIRRADQRLMLCSRAERMYHRYEGMEAAVCQVVVAVH